MRSTSPSMVSLLGPRRPDRWDRSQRTILALHTHVTFDLEEAVAVGTQARPKAEIFQLKAPLLSVGRDNWPLIRTDLVSLTLKVYAEGGENAMHYHTNEEHSFIVLQGEATFHLDTEENAHVVHQWEGVFLPKGA